MSFTQMLQVAAAATLAVVFAFAVVGKATANGFRGLRDGVRALWPGRSLSPTAERGIAFGVLIVEAVIAAALLLVPILPGVARPAFAAAALLMAAFLAAQGLALARGAKGAPCACFGRSTSEIGPVTLARDGVLLAVAVLGLVAPAGSGSAEEIVAAFAGLVIGLLIVTVEDIVALFAPGVRS